MITKYIKDNILNTELKIIAHGCNCKNAMGSGVAKAIYEKYPEVKSRYHRYCEGVLIQRGGKSEQLLGDIQVIESKGKTIVNCFTQLNYGYDGKRYLNYAALVECFKHLTVTFPNARIAIPKIGAGLAGGNWEFIEELINDATGDNLEVWVYEI